LPSFLRVIVADIMLARVSPSLKLLTFPTAIQKDATCSLPPD
jgi:hypothetical protein